MSAADEAILDRLTQLVALDLGTPLAALGIIDGEAIHFRSRIGLALTRIAREDASFLMRRVPVVIPDTQLDAVAAKSPLAREPPHIRFYAGMPLIAADGTHLGMICGMDTQPHPPPNAFQRASLSELAALATAELEKHRGSGTYLSEPGAGAIGEPRDSTHRNLLAAYVAKSEFLASLSHELRTPLNAILGYADLIGSADDSSSANIEHAEEIAVAARHMLALVNDVLEYSRLEAGTISISWQRVALRSAVEESLRMVRVFAASRGVNLANDISWPDAMVRADPVRLKQVLLNLLTNGIKFTPRDGTVTVSLSRTAEGLAELAVHDTGTGIAPSDIPKTLIPFGQIVPKDGTPVEGTGLGLPIAKDLVERLGGQLLLESELGQGTVVRILLPPLPASRPASRASNRDQPA